jgi:hypothetical protein
MLCILTQSSFSPFESFRHVWMWNGLLKRSLLIILTWKLYLRLLQYTKPIYSESISKYANLMNTVFSPILTLCMSVSSQLPEQSSLASPSHASYFNPLTPELNPSTQRCLTTFLLGILLLEPCISLTYALKTNKCANYTFSLLIMYGSSCTFRHYVAILRERS